MARKLMRATGLPSAAAALLLVACSEPAAGPAEAVASLEGDEALIAQAQTLSDSLGGCEEASRLDRTSRVVSLPDVSIVLLACSGSRTSYTDRLFAISQGQPMRLLALADYGPRGWFANFEAGMAELDAGAGVLTTLRSDGPNDVCGSEGRYRWDGQTFAVDEMNWRSCDSQNTSGPPFPLIWPPQINSTVDPGSSTPPP